MTFTPVQLETPFKSSSQAQRARNVAYARACMRDCLLRDEAPFASHLLYTQPGVLDDDKTHERELGIEAGLALGKLMHKTVVYTDLGISSGMQRGIDRAEIEGRPVEYRTLGGIWKGKKT